MKPKIPLARCGVPLRTADWTIEDWMDLYLAMESAIAKIKKRHATPAPEPISQQPPPSNNQPAAPAHQT